MGHEMVAEYFNPGSLLDVPVLFDEERRKATCEYIARVFGESIGGMESSREQYVPIPEEVLSVYRTYRPTPLVRACDLEKALGVSGRIYYKNEGLNPTGTHKPNSALLLAYACKKDGFSTITTETSGNWGIALGYAVMAFGIEGICFLDRESHEHRPDRKGLMEEAGCKVVITPSRETAAGRAILEKDPGSKGSLVLSADEAIEYAAENPGAIYLFGSVFNYFTLPQSVMGLEAKAQLAELGEKVDYVVGSCGGGANLLGLSGVFLSDVLRGDDEVKVVSAESTVCPILSKGELGYFGIDAGGRLPQIYTYGFGHECIMDGEYVGGLNSNIVSPVVSRLHRDGLIEARTYSRQQALEAGKLFYEAEGFPPALESCFQIAAVCDIARETGEVVILCNVSSGERDKHIYD